MQTDQLIIELTQELRPVRPLAPPTLRGVLWLAVLAALLAVLLWRFANWTVFLQRMATPRTAVECAAIAVTGITAVLSAFVVSVPGRSLAWRLLPLPSCLVWIAASGLGCLQNGWSLHGPGGFIGESSHCFVFIVGVSVPLAVALFVALRRARPIAPLPVAALGTLGVAALAAFILEFFHPFDVTAIDLALHMAAIGLVILIGVTLRSRLLAPA